MKKEDCYTNSRLGSYLRFILLPAYLLVYFIANGTVGRCVAAGIIVLSVVILIWSNGLSGKDKELSGFERLLCYLADKFSQLAIAISLTFEFTPMRYMVAVLAVKEIIVFSWGFVLHKCGKNAVSMHWSEKAANMVFYAVMTILVFYAEIRYFIAGIMTYLSISFLIFSLCCYIHISCMAMRNKKTKSMGIIRSIIIMLAVTIALSVYVGAGVIIEYHKQPVLTEERKAELRNGLKWKQTESVETVRIISDNKNALYERIRLIESAKNEIVMTVFDFHYDNSSRLLIAALIKAADRGVSVKVLVDGYNSSIRMEWNPYFYALSSNKNVELKTYNYANVFTPWKSMGRMHDKYLIIDNKTFILGGRNINDYFLGDFRKKQNYDWDMLVECDKPDSGSAVSQLLKYFESMWNYRESRYFHNDHSISRFSSVKQAKKDMLVAYEEYCQAHKNEINANASETAYVADHILLLSNPINYQSKEPTLWFCLSELMKQAKNSVVIHTPYVICNDMMYRDFESIASNVKDVKLMTNSAANNANFFGAADYIQNKDRILSTGVDVWEHESGYSYHGKSILIDDNISIVGSFNMDMRSTYLDTELMLVIESREINSRMKEKMLFYEQKARKANKDGSYDNPYNVTPMELSGSRKRMITASKHFVKKFRFLF